MEEIETTEEAVKDFTNADYVRMLSQANRMIANELQNLCYGAWNPLFMSDKANLHNLRDIQDVIQDIFNRA